MLPSLPIVALGTVLRLLAPPAPPVTRLSGHLDHAPAGDTVRLWVGQKQAKTPLDPAGNFQFVFTDVAATTPVHFEYAKQRTRLYLMPGDQLVMRLDFTIFDKSLTYSGSGSAANNYLAQAQWKFEYGPAGAVPRPTEQLRQKPTTTPAEMRRNADAFRRAQLAFLASYAQAHPLPASFRHDAEFFINVQWGKQLLDYVAYQRQPQPGALSPPPLAAGYFSFLSQVPLRELAQHMRGLDENTAVGWFIYAYQNRLVPSGKLSTDPTEGPRLYQLATQELGSGKMRDWAMQLLMSWKVDADLDGAQVFCRTFRLHNADSVLARDVRQLLAQKQRLRVGQPAPAFTLLDHTGKAVSLTDFKGQVVYLDFWGTWCAPCMREMTEFSHALKKQFAGRAVVFLYVSQGDPEARWQQTLRDRQLTGPGSVHLREPSESRQVATAYQVHQWPTYWLIGRDGRILDPAAPRPSDGAKTVAAIEAALKG